MIGICNKQRMTFFLVLNFENKNCGMNVKFVFFFFWECERAKEHERVGVVLRENLKRAPCLGRSRTLGLNLRTLRSWPELESGVGRLTYWATQAPHFFKFFLSYCYRPSLIKTNLDKSLGNQGTDELPPPPSSLSRWNGRFDHNWVCGYELEQRNQKLSGDGELCWIRRVFWVCFSCQTRCWISMANCGQHYPLG